MILTNPEKLFIPPSLDIMCVLYGHPKPKVTWFYNNNPLNNVTRGGRLYRGCGRNYEIRVTDENIDSEEHTLSVLKICNPTPQNSGEYFCQGANRVGTVNSTSIQITVPAGMYASLFNTCLLVTFTGTYTNVCIYLLL